jgi:hypothetical protein
MQAHGSRSAEAHLYRWEGEGPWERLTVGLPDPFDSMPYALAFAGDSLVAGLADGRIYRSDDRGDSWEAVGIEGDPPEQIVALAQLAGPSS